MTRTMTTIAALAISTSAAIAQDVTVTVAEVTDSQWYTPDPRCGPDYKHTCRYTSESTDHRGRLTENDRCLYIDMDGKFPGDTWCDATWVKTRNVNNTHFWIQVRVECTAFDRAGRALVSETSNVWPGVGPVSPEDEKWSSNMRPFGEGSSYMRLAAKFADVATVECRPVRVTREPGWPNPPEQWSGIMVVYDKCLGKVTDARRVLLRELNGDEGVVRAIVRDVDLYREKMGHDRFCSMVREVLRNKKGTKE